MITKHTTIILTLLFCLSGSVIAEKKEVPFEKQPTYQAAKIYDKLKSNEIEVFEIIKNLNKTRGVNGIKNLKLEQERNLAIITNLAQIQSKLKLILNILRYENEILLMDNDHNITYLHNFLRKDAFEGYKNLIIHHIKNFKEMRVLFSTTATVLEVKSIIENLEELEKWVHKEENLMLDGNKRVIRSKSK